MQVSILTPLFNRLDLTRVFLESLERTLRRWRYEVILVDDGSTDGTREFLGTLAGPKYRVVLNERGLGYAANNNLAARLAQAPLLCLLNNDIALLPGWLEPMARLAARLPDVACVGNVQREPVSGLVDHCGIYFREDGIPLHAGKDSCTPPTEDYLEWPAVTAACCVVRREVFLGLGGFHEAYRNGLEDVDFCLRASGRGFRHFVANRSVIYHHVSASPGRKTHEEANVRRFLGSWREFLTREAARPRTLAGQREAGWNYLRKHRWQPWRYNAWRVARAVEQVWSPQTASRRLDAGARWMFAWEEAGRRQKAEGRRQKAEGCEEGMRRRDAKRDAGGGRRDGVASGKTGGGGVGGAEGRETSTDGNRSGRPTNGDANIKTVFLVVGETAQTADRSGVPSAVRGLAGAFGRRGDPVRLVGWCARGGSLRGLPPDWSLGADAEALRSGGGRGAEGMTPSLYDPAAGWPDDPLARSVGLHELAEGELPPIGSWVVLPEVLYGGQMERLVEYVRRHGWRLAVVLHDLLAVNEPELFAPGVPNEHARYLYAVSRADVVLPVSDFTANDWRIFAGAKGLGTGGRVEVCRLAADTVSRPRVVAEGERRDVSVGASGGQAGFPHPSGVPGGVDEVPGVLPPANFPHPSGVSEGESIPGNNEPRRQAGAPVRVLCVASVEMRKNFPALMEAFAEADRRRPELRLELCCVGEERRGPGNPAAAIHEAMRRFPGRVSWYERVEYGTLRRLYEACDFTVYPSVLEGFGLPILESLWFRKPCVCANFGAMDEVAYGGGCVTVDVRDAGALAQAVVALAGDAARREALAAEIDARWLRCWEEYARDLLELLGGERRGE